MIDLTGETMGTHWHIRLARPTGLDLELLRRAVQGRLDGLEWQMSHWRPDSVLCGFNRAPAGLWAVLPADFATVMRIGLAIAARSGGAFDPTIGALVDLWGFGPVAGTAPPSNDAVARARGCSGWERTNFDVATSRLRQPGGLRLDLSGIAKGYAVDATAALLAHHGVRHCLVEIGGELAGRGLKPDGEPWWVDLEHPGSSALPRFRAALHEWAVATSGDYVRGAHNLDSATGRPAMRDVVSVSVFHASAMQADAWASALTVLGQEAGLALAAREGLAARIVTRDAAGLREVLTPALHDLL
ncbi:FAD:protein FMN transferase [Sphingomonas sp. MMS24-J13]|uniref:FAD:protein FMN transferase n=1 Tax=Sphingomonas sp. MMS24-J13 TaxID=3238686 RepID=UPI00384B7115